MALTELKPRGSGGSGWPCRTLTLIRARAAPPATFRLVFFGGRLPINDATVAAFVPAWDAAAVRPNSIPTPCLGCGWNRDRRGACADYLVERIALAGLQPLEAGFLVDGGCPGVTDDHFSRSYL